MILRELILIEGGDLRADVGEVVLQLRALIGPLEEGDPVVVLVEDLLFALGQPLREVPLDVIQAQHVHEEVRRVVP